MPRFTRRRDEDLAVLYWAELIAGGLPDDEVEARRPQIFALARTWEEMSRTMPRPAALASLRAGLGTTYDPECVGALLWGLGKISAGLRMARETL